ncbi:dTDP-4-dehydrorhamnose reductase [Alkaliphilus hydrothermalis]|uniref:dTDP-4-dehydrorhamnose reductase n=1 Tax=Alkaliphilus hydrothermalis TaxID=1482730 RepID=A0ABS2NLX0_9FIRM|nr:dTDP-4-dehydrorhamnose reductase [Alkaliphilus hydrothermalis]MBM7613936.1 dTDP-4-dehydrorhamnose reductase [Alkaliphilus hydrothermalis]
MKICILGGTGQLGNELNKVLQHQEIYSFGKKDFDITNLEESYKRLRVIDPEVIIHAAAYTNVDGCEKKQDVAQQVNVEGTENIAKISERIGSRLIYISSDYVFDGEKETPYDEGDQPNPINVYGKTKYAGELEVMKNTDKHFIVRTAWLYGHKGKNFIQTVLNLATSKTLLNVVDDQRGCPTYALDLAAALGELTKLDDYGIYHLVNEGNCTWYELADTICRCKKLSAKVNPIKTTELNQKAPRPKNSSLSNNSSIKMRDWQEAVESFLKS